MIKTVDSYPATLTEENIRKELSYKHTHMKRITNVKQDHQCFEL